MKLPNFPRFAAIPTQGNRPIRLRVWVRDAALDDVLLVKHVHGREVLCGGFEYRLLCVATHAGLQLKEFMALPVELQFVTDRGGLRSVCGIVARASAGRSDGGLAAYELVVRDALALMEHRVNTRIFRDLNEVDISEQLVREWQHANPILAAAFDLDTSGVTQRYPARAYTMQQNEHDAAFLRRLWKRRGLAWSMRHVSASVAGGRAVPLHQDLL